MLRLSSKPLLHHADMLNFQFSKPTQGRITVGGEDVRMFDKSEWAKVVSIVNQVCIHNIYGSSMVGLFIFLFFKGYIFV